MFLWDWTAIGTAGQKLLSTVLYAHRDPTTSQIMRETKHSHSKVLSSNQRLYWVKPHF